MMQLAERKHDTEILPAPIESIDNFLASSVHDMKNSVTLLLSGLEKTLGSPGAAKLSTYSELIQANHEAKRIHNQLVQLLAAYKLDHKIYPFDPQYICLADFLSALNDQYAGLLKMHDIALEIDADPDLYWYFDEDLVSGVIGNAINNAMRYTRDRIVIGAEELDKKLILRIEDNGAGYPSQFIRQQGNFVQGVNFHEGNTGLGFYFSMLVARMHRNHDRVGIFELKNGGSLGGACFILQLP
jgi:signal transduction histidine kinase